MIRELVDALARLPDAAREGVVVVGDARPNPSLANVRVIARAIGGVLSPAGHAFARADVVVRLAPSAPDERARLETRTVACCYDVIPLKAPRAHFPLHRIVRHPTLWLGYHHSLDVTRRAAAVWTISRAVADDVERLLGVPRARLFPIALAPATTLVVPSATVRAEALAKHGLRAHEYLLWMLGGTNENKNVPGMLRVMAADKALPELVIAGGMSPSTRRKILTQALALGAPPPRFLPHIADAEVGALMHASRAVVVPSLDEGFGLPVVEGLACGARVVANDIPVLREVGGGDAEYADVGDASAFASVLCSEAPAQRRPYVARRWETVAADVLALAAHVAARSL